MSDDVQLQPDDAAVLQEEGPEAYPLTTVDVCVKDVTVPVRVKVLPNVAGGTRTRAITTAAERILGADHYRAAAVLCSFDQDFLYAFTEVGASDPSTMARQPKNVPLRVTTSTEVWVAAQTATTDLSVATERWAAGA